MECRNCQSAIIYAPISFNERDTTNVQLYDSHLRGFCPIDFILTHLSFLSASKHHSRYPTPNSQPSPPQHLLQQTIILKPYPPPRSHQPKTPKPPPPQTDAILPKHEHFTNSILAGQPKKNPPRVPTLSYRVPPLDDAANPDLPRSTFIVLKSSTSARSTRNPWRCKPPDRDRRGELGDWRIGEFNTQAS